MRILMVIHRIPFPPRTGEKVRAYHFARHLAAHHDLTLACLADEPGAPEAIAGLRREFDDVECVTIARRRKRATAVLSLAAGGSATMAYFDAPELKRRVAARLAEGVDLVFLYSSSTIQYVASAPGVPVVMDFVDVDSAKWRQYADQVPVPQRWIYRAEAARLRRWELAAARRASHSVVATRDEARLLHDIAGRAPTTVIGNGVDLEYFTPADVPGREPVLVFSGAMDYLPNVDGVTHFCERIFPAVRARVPGARFVIAGRGPVPAVRRLAEQPGVDVTGTVDDIRPYLRAAAVAVVPLRIARGVQNKVLEAMAMALPVVATPGAHGGIDARVGRHLLVEDDPARFAAAVVALLESPERRAALGAEARRFVESRHSWASSFAQIDGVLEHVARRAPVAHAAASGDRA